MLISLLQIMIFLPSLSKQELLEIVNEAFSQKSKSLLINGKNQLTNRCK